jgi:hypothetical protein
MRMRLLGTEISIITSPAPLAVVGTLVMIASNKVLGTPC